MNDKKNQDAGTMKQGENYDPSSIEPKWQKIWEEENLYATPKDAKNKKYVLDMFPYPSGATLHVGHIEGYVGTDIIARFERMKGADVLHPMGWDAFGLPAENYAIASGIHPDRSTHENIKTFKRQLSGIGLSYDWTREIDTSDPKYYKWTQWIFTLMFRKGLAYKKQADVNWCPKDETVLANEQVIDGRCERCDTEVVAKKLDQWFLRITEYADRLIEGLDDIDWLPEVKIQQKNWIGKSDGALINFSIDGTDSQINPKSTLANSIKAGIKVFTTRPDTLYGATFIVISPEHEIAQDIDDKEVKNYIIKAKNTSYTDRTDEKKAKTGVFSGLYAINPVNREKIPVWIADYVLMGYGTGAIMAVPAHDTRDFEFAKKYNLPIKFVIEGGESEDSAYTGEGKIINSENWNGWETPASIGKVIASLEEQKIGQKESNYHIRDWLISRQRYWGVPIPMIYCESCATDGKGEREDLPGWYAVPDDQLPVRLPTDVDFKPTGESPIARSKTFQEGAMCPSCGSKAKREVDTMDTYVDSSWYFIRFVDPQNTQEFASKEAIKAWLPVDVYVGGGHVVQHLLFARFFWKVLFDAGLLDESVGDEPFIKLRAPGWILGPDSRKMSKRWKNVITPDDIIPKFGADTLRMYEMFMGPFEAMKPWSLSGVEGSYRFLGRLWKFFRKVEVGEDDQETKVAINRLVKDVSEDLDGMFFNTAIAKMMEFYNLVKDKKNLSKETLTSYLKLIAPFAPHMSEEIWEQLGFGGLQLENKTNRQEPTAKSQSIHKSSWPTYDEKYLVKDEIIIPIQVNGKRRGEISIKYDVSSIKYEEEIAEKAKGVISSYLEGKEIRKIIYVPGKIINFVI